MVKRVRKVDHFKVGDLDSIIEEVVDKSVDEVVDRTVDEVVAKSSNRIDEMQLSKEREKKDNDGEVNSYNRVRVCVVYFCTGLILTLFPLVYGVYDTVLRLILFCIGAGFLGLALRVWQMREYKEAGKVADIEPYKVYYPARVIVFSLLMFGISGVIFKGGVEHQAFLFAACFLGGVMMYPR